MTYLAHNSALDSQLYNNRTIALAFHHLSKNDCMPLFRSWWSMQLHHNLQAWESLWFVLTVQQLHSFVNTSSRCSNVQERNFVHDNVSFSEKTTIEVLRLFLQRYEPTVSLLSVRWRSHSAWSLHLFQISVNPIQLSYLTLSAGWVRVVCFSVESAPCWKLLKPKQTLSSTLECHNVNWPFKFSTYLHRAAIAFI